MISLKQINDKVVKKIRIPEEDKRPIKGFDVCPEVFANIFLCAKKKSGKTSAIFKLLKECALKKTILIVFCSTAYKDKNWIEMRKYFERKGMDIRVFTSIYENGEDQIDKLVNELNEEAKANEGIVSAPEQKEDEYDDGYGEEDPYSEPFQEPVNPYDNIIDRLSAMCFPKEEGGEDNIGIGDLEPKKKPRKSKYQAPEYIIVFDDLSGELKSKSLLNLLKKNRHFKTKLIISSQWVHDLLPESRKQLDLFLIFKGFPEKKMEAIHKDCDTGVPFDTFYKIYKKATKRPFSFMYIDTRSDEFRRNFNEQFILTTKEEVST